MEIPFIKMHGLGNNYIYLDLFQITIQQEWLVDLAQKISNVNTGIGSDGLILIQPSTVADLGMRIFNKDGSEGQSCGNGLRCTAKYAYTSGIVARNNFSIETKAGVVGAEVDVAGERVENITINMGTPRLNRSSIPMLGNNDDSVIDELFIVGDEALKITALFIGNPHAVIFVNSIENAPLVELGPIIENDSRFPERTNVEFVEIVSETEINFRVWERGSGVTEACGSGACAAVVAAILNRHVKRNEWITVHLQGGDLQIKWDDNGNVWMAGEAEVIAKGTFHYRID